MSPSRKWPTLREFLAEDLYPIPPIPPSQDRATGVRQPSEQALALFAATPGQYITVKTDFDLLLPLIGALESRLDLDTPVAAEIPLHFARCAAESRNAAAVQGPSLKDEMQRAYDIVNNLIRCSLRKDAVFSGKWTTVDEHADGHAHLAIDPEHPEDAYVSGTPDAICAVDTKRETSALGLLECTVTGKFSDDRDIRRQKATMRSKDGMTIYLSHASRNLRAWNSNLANGTAQFWVNFIAQIWEEMHQYHSECVVTTSWKFTSLVKRTGVNCMVCSPISIFDRDLSGRLNMLQILTGLALFKEDDGFTKWTQYPDTPTLPRKDCSENRPGDLTPKPGQSQASVTITGLEKLNRVVAQLTLQGATEEERARFLEGPSGGETYNLQLGDHVGSGRTFDCYKVRHTNLVSTSVNLVAKIVNLAAYPICDAKWKRSRAATREAASAEAILYEGPLAPLQGVTVPRYFGLWTGTVTPSLLGGVHSNDSTLSAVAEKRDNCHEIMIMLLEDVGRAIADRSEYISDFDAVDLVDLYGRLHSANVVHGDIGVKHVMRLGDHLRLIDFEGSWSVDPDKPIEYVDLLDEKRTLLREFKQPVPPALENLTPPWEL